MALGKTRFSIPSTTWAYITILTVLVVGAIMRDINLLIILAGMMCGPLLISWQMIRTNLKRLTIRRQLPRAVDWGRPFDVRYRIHNGRKHIDSWAIVLNDQLSNATAKRRLKIANKFELTRTDNEKTAPHLASCMVAHVAVGDAKLGTYQAQLRDRGRYDFGPLKVSTRVPVGLLKGTGTQRQTDHLLVFPRMGYLLRGWRDLVQFDEAGQRNVHRRQGRSEGDFFGLRDWRSGDCPRWIHWRSSAKRNELVVRQFEQRRDQDLVMLLDLAGLSRSDLQATLDSEDDPIEKAVSFVATALAEQSRRGVGQITLRIAGATNHEARGPASSAFLNDVLELLAECLPDTDDATPAQRLGPLPETRREDFIVVVRPGPIDLSRWQEGESAQKTKARFIPVDTASAEFESMFSWQDDDTLPVATQDQDDRHIAMEFDRLGVGQTVVPPPHLDLRNDPRGHEASLAPNHSTEEQGP